MSEIQRVGIVGDGQLGRMMAQANNNADLGLDITVLGTGDPNGPKSPAGQIDGVRQLYGESLYDRDALSRLAETVGTDGVITWEVEHIAAYILEEFRNEGFNVQSSPESLRLIQDKLWQKLHLSKHGIDVAPYADLSTTDQRIKAFTDFEKIIIKSRTGGYDGRGNYVPAETDTWVDVVDRFTDGSDNRPMLYAEKIVPFQRELALVGVRNLSGSVAVYPLVETVHKNNICHTTFAPALLDPKVRDDAIELGRATIDTFDGAGVFAVEMFQTNDDTVLVNEVAPRVHNSGHWTIEGAQTSQFENHLRAITGMPIGSTNMQGPGVATMVNILGTRTMDSIPNFPLSDPDWNIYIHGYGKTPRMARKIGHITVLADVFSIATPIAKGVRATIGV